MRDDDGGGGGGGGEEAYLHVIAFRESATYFLRAGSRERPAVFDKG